ncbi:MAG: queuosine precursor transporter [Gammaproteobacteria bacterium]|nr:queuosine precursor transporter [Gammaproteobacteria bacterium]
MGYRMIAIGPTLETGSIFIFPFTYFFGDIVAEVYGYKVAKNLIWTSLVCEAVFAITANLVDLLPYHGSPFHQAAYAQLVPLFMRVLLVNVVSTLISEFLNVYCVTKWKILLSGRFYWLRSLGAAAIGAFVYSISATIISFAGILTVTQMVKLMLSCYLIKEVIFVLITPVGVLIVLFLKKAERVDAYDYHTNFNPFAREISEA